jgi:hypothetical protein
MVDFPLSTQEGMACRFLLRAWFNHGDHLALEGGEAGVAERKEKADRTSHS